MNSSDHEFTDDSSQAGSNSQSELLKPTFVKQTSTFNPFKSIHPESIAKIEAARVLQPATWKGLLIDEIFLLDESDGQKENDSFSYVSKAKSLLIKLRVVSCITSGKSQGEESNEPFPSGRIWKSGKTIWQIEKNNDGPLILQDNQRETIVIEDGLRVDLTQNKGNNPSPGQMKKAWSCLEEEIEVVLLRINLPPSEKYVITGLFFLYCCLTLILVLIVVFVKRDEN